MDWYSYSRAGQLAWVGNLNTVLATRAADWGIPSSHVMQMLADHQAATSIFAKVGSSARTSADVAQCNMVFDEMETEARYIKRHYLISPPLTAADLALLMLPAPDGTFTPVPPPAGQPLVTLSYPGGPHAVAVHLGPLPGTEAFDPRSDYGYAIYLGLMPPGGATLEQAAGPEHYLMKPAHSGKGLLHYRFTRRRTEVVEFDESEAGMTAFFCSRYENQKGFTGMWGPPASITVPQ
jgi:hypothetical protein